MGLTIAVAVAAERNGMRNARNSRSLVLLATILIGGCNRGGGGGGGGSVEPKTEDEKTLYALGLFEGGNIKRFGLNDHELAIVQSGIADAVKAGKPKVDLQEYR